VRRRIEVNITVPGWVLLMLSAFTAFIIGASAPLLAVVAVLSGGPIPLVAWVISVVSGLLVMAKDIRSCLSLPTVDVSRPPVPLPLDKTGVKP
jgi:hypothetical protein